jgi:hypothetical protein
LIDSYAKKGDNKQLILIDKYAIGPEYLSRPGCFKGKYL